MDRESAAYCSGVEGKQNSVRASNVATKESSSNVNSLNRDPSYNNTNFTPMQLATKLPVSDSFILITQPSM